MFFVRYLTPERSQLISFSNTWVKNGFVLDSDLENIWKDLSPAEVRQTMQLFVVYNVAFPQLEKGRWVVPCMLPRDRQGAPLTWRAAAAFRRHERVFQMVSVGFPLLGCEK